MGTVETCFSTYLSYSETVWATLIQFGYIKRSVYPCSNYLGPLKDEYISINHNCILIYDIRLGGGGVTSKSMVF